MDETIYQSFKNGSTTHFYSSIFFTKDVREDIFILYAFARKADDLVDSNPPEEERFQEFRKAYLAALQGRTSDDPVVNSFVTLIKKKKVNLEWVTAFLDTMEQDLYKNVYATLDETRQYMYGSAEVVGLMIAKVAGLPKKLYPYAQAMGRAYQYVNFIRDIAEDNSFNRMYLPYNEVQDFGLPDLSRESAEALPDRFHDFITAQVERYQQWQEEAEAGYSYMPLRLLIGIKTAADMYHWTAQTILADPQAIFRKKIKPSKLRVIWTGIRNAVELTFKRLLRKV